MHVTYIDSFLRLVQAGSTRHCSNHKQQRLPPTSGYLASALVTDRGFGSSRCPWIITVQTGQRINITLHNFARTTTIATSSKSSKCEKHFSYINQVFNPAGFVTGSTRREKTKVRCVDEKSSDFYISYFAQNNS